MIVNRIPKEWLDVLSEVQLEFPSAVIAGGSLRDLYYNKVPKDVDIFIPTSAFMKYDPAPLYHVVSKIDNNMQIKLLEGYGFTTRLPSQSDRLKTIKAVYGVSYKGTAFDIIAIETNSKRVIDDFDMSINQIQYDGDVLQLTQAFHNTYYTHIITYVNRDELKREESRLKRIKDKFPEFEVNDEN